MLTWCSASQLFIQNGAMTFLAVVQKQQLSMLHSLCSCNSAIVCAFDSSNRFWHSSVLVKWHKSVYMWLFSLCLFLCFFFVSLFLFVPHACTIIELNWFKFSHRFLSKMYLCFCCSLTPHRGESFNLESVVISENFPLTAVSLFAAAGPHYIHALTQVVSQANSVYSNFMKSEEGYGFSGQVGIMCRVFAFLPHVSIASSEL